MINGKQDWRDVSFKKTLSNIQREFAECTDYDVEDDYVHIKRDGDVLWTMTMDDFERDFFVDVESGENGVAL